MADFEVRGSDDIDRLVKAIRKDANAKALRKEMYSGLNRVSKSMRGQMVEVIPAALPRRGGLADLVKSTTRSRTTAKSGRWAGVTIRFTNSGHDIRTLTGKRLRHPVWGNRNAWVEQRKGVHPGVFMGKFEQQKPAVQRAILDIMNDVARKVTSI